MMIPVESIQTASYNIPQISELSGKMHYTEYGTPVAMEYWEKRPDFALISQPIIGFLREHFLHQRIGLRMLGSEEHERKTVDDLISIIQRIGHDRYDMQRKDNLYYKIDPNEIELFMLELEIGQELGIDGEEQVQHALQSFYVFPEIPIRVDIGIVYDLSGLKRKKLVYRGREEIGHEIINPQAASESILALFKLI